MNTYGCANARAASDTDAALKGTLATAGVLMLDASDGACVMVGGIVDPTNVQLLAQKSERI